MYDYNRVTLELQQLDNRYETCHLSSIGKSLCGRSLHLFRIGSGEKKVLYAGAFHGLEWITAAMLTHFSRRLCQAQGKRLDCIWNSRPAAFERNLILLYSHGKSRWSANFAVWRTNCRKIFFHFHRKNPSMASQCPRS